MIAGDVTLLSDLVCRDSSVNVLRKSARFQFSSKCQPHNSVTGEGFREDILPCLHCCVSPCTLTYAISCLGVLWADIAEIHVSLELGIAALLKKAV